MNFGSSNQIIQEDKDKVKRWKQIQNILDKKSNFGRQASVALQQQKSGNINDKQRASMHINHQEQFNLNQEREVEVKRTSLFSNAKRESTNQNKGGFSSIINKVLKGKMDNVDSTSKGFDTNLPSPINNQTSTNIQRQTSPNQNCLEEFSNKSNEHDEKKSSGSDLEQSQIEQEGVYFKDFDSMQGEYQIHAQVDQIFSLTFLQLVNDPTYDPTERLLTQQAQARQQKISMNDRLKKTNKRIMRFFKKTFCCQKYKNQQNESDISHSQSNKLSSSFYNLKQSFYKVIKQSQVAPEQKIPHIYQQKKKAKRYDFIISPDSPFRITWDIFCMILIIYAIIMVPFRLSFDSDDQFTTLIQVDAIFDYIFMVDIVFNFNTAVYVNGSLIKKRRVIMIEYLKLWFWLDFFSSFPYDIVVQKAISDEEVQQEQLQKSSSNPNVSGSIQKAQQIIRMLKFFRIMKVLKLLRVAKLKLIVEKLVEYLKLSKSVLGVLGFLKLSSIVLFIAHWIACMWHLLGSQFPDDGWIVAQGLWNEDWDVKYISSIYWAITTMVTVGYGDIVPKNKEEKLFTIFIMLLACGIFAYTMNTMGVVLSEIESFSSEYKKEIQQVNRYLENKKVKLELKIRIRKYLEYIYESKQKNQIDETNLFSKLSSSLKNDLIHQINEKVINNCYLLTELFDKQNLQQFLFQISINLQEKITIPEEIIIDQDDNGVEDDKSMYFIQDGEVEIFFQHSNTKTILKRLGAGSYFGEISFFTDLKRSASVQSVNFASLYYLRRSDFLKILQKFPNQKEIFCEIQDKIKIYNNFDCLNIKCFSCEQKNHISANCTNLSFSYFKNKFIEKFLQAKKKNTKDFIRRDYSKFRTIKEMSKLLGPQQKMEKTLLVLSYIRVHNIDREISGDKELPSFLSKVKGNLFADKVKQAIINSNQQERQNKKQKKQNQMISNQHSNEHILQMQYWKQVEEFDKVKIYDHYFKHNNIQQADTDSDYLIQKDNYIQSQLQNDKISEKNIQIMPLITKRRKYQQINENGNPTSLVQIGDVNTPRASQKNISSNNNQQELESSYSSQSSEGQNAKEQEQEQQQFNQNKSINVISSKSLKKQKILIIEDNQEIGSSINMVKDQRSEQEYENQNLFNNLNSQFNNNIEDFEDYNLHQDSINYQVDINTPPISTKRQIKRNQLSEEQGQNYDQNKIKED